MKPNRPRGLTEPLLLSLPDGDTLRGWAVAAACGGFCEFYRGDQGEEGCGGLRYFIGTLTEGAITAETLSRIVDTPPPPPEKVTALTESLCASCSYLPDGCDFMSPTPPEGATPCGGYRVLQLLLRIQALDAGIL